MALTFGTALRTAIITAIAKYEDRATPTWNAAASGGLLQLFSGATVLVSINLPSPCFTVGTGSMTKAGTWSSTVIANGTATTFKLITNDDGVTPDLSGTVGLGTGDISLDNNVLAIGGTVTISTFTLTQPAS